MLYYHSADFWTQKLFIQLTESGTDYYRVGASMQNQVGRVGVLPSISYLFIYLFRMLIDIN